MTDTELKLSNFYGADNRNCEHCLWFDTQEFINDRFANDPFHCEEWKARVDSMQESEGWCAYNREIVDSKRENKFCGYNLAYNYPPELRSTRYCIDCIYWGTTDYNKCDFVDGVCEKNHEKCKHFKSKHPCDKPAKQNTIFD